MKYRVWSNNEFQYHEEDFQLYADVKDSKGNPIYEGDIVKGIWNGIFPKDKVGFIGVVEWSTLMLRFMIYLPSEGGWVILNHDDIEYLEVIGNEKENPNLLEGVCAI